MLSYDHGFAGGVNRVPLLVQNGRFGDARQVQTRHSLVYLGLQHARSTLIR